MNLPTIEEVADLCREHGDWRPVGPDHDLLYWLKRKLARADKADEAEAQLDNYECDDCYEKDHQLSKLECERNELKRELAERSGSAPAQPFKGMESVRQGAAQEERG